MRSLAHLLLLGTLATISSGSLVQDVPSDTFKKLVRDNSLVLTAFTSKTIPSLQPFSDTFRNAAQDASTPFVIVDCGEQENICREYDVNAYPTIRLFRKDGERKEGEGEVIRYRGHRTESAIQSFVIKYELPPLSYVEPDALADFKEVDDTVVLAYLRPDQKELLNVFRTVADKRRGDFVFGYVTDMPAADKEGMAMPSIVCYRNLDGDNKVVNGHFTENDVEALLDLASKTVIGDFSERNAETYMAKDKLTVYIFTDTDSSQIAVRRELTPLAKKYAQYVTFGVADAVEYAPMAQSFGVSDKAYPALAVHAPMNDNAFLYKQGRVITATVVEEMLTTILQAKATNGQVFGTDAPVVERIGVIDAGSVGSHDEL